MQGKHNKYTCRECHKTKRGNYFISPTLCKKCASKRRVKKDNTPIRFNDITNNTEYLITPASLERISKRAEKEVEYGVLDFIAVIITIIQYVLIVTYLNEISKLIGIFSLFILFMPYGLYLILKIPRRKKIEKHIGYLIDKRKMDYEDRAKLYSSPEWKILRKQIINSSANICSNCGKRINVPNDLTVDHIKPRSKYPNLSYDINNLTILCRSCNSMKGNRETE